MGVVCVLGEHGLPFLFFDLVQVESVPVLFGETAHFVELFASLFSEGRPVLVTELPGEVAQSLLLGQQVADALHLFELFAQVSYSF